MRLLLLCIPLILLVVPSAWCTTPKEELKGVRQEINAKKQLITKTRKVEEVVSTELLDINRKLSQKVTELGRLDLDLASVESSLARTGREIIRVTDEAKRKKREIDRRLVSLYKAGELGALRMFFSAESLPNMAENIRYMSSILDNDKKIFLEYNEKITQLQGLKTTLEQDAAKKERIKKGISQKKLEIEEQKGKKAAYLTKVRQDRKSYEASLKELQANASRLQAMIERLDALSRRKLSSRHEKPDSRLKSMPELPQYLIWALQPRRVA